MYYNPLFCQTYDNAIRWQPSERLDHLFEERCDQVGRDHVALITEDETLTFWELDNRANQVARYLLDQGFRAGDRVGLLLDKSAHAYVGLVAVLKIGAAYVPLDSSFPSDRISYILQDARVAAIVSVSRFREKLDDFPVEKIFLDQVEAETRLRSVARLSDLERPRSGDQLFYVIYTSGTTGKPKGVAIEHGGICNFVKVAGEVYGITEGDRCYQGITLAFDFHVEDLWVPLIRGATLVAGKSGTSLFGNDLHQFLLDQRVTVLPGVPTLLATIDQDLPDVRIVLLSGEAVPHELVVRWHRPGRSILNAYGPTECSVSSTLRTLVPDSPVTIGRPLPTYMVVILDEQNDELVGDGEIGEIGIAGIGLALGYLNRDELTKQKFVRDFIGLPNNPSGRIYRTGDLGRVREDGELEFHGRIDTQVKIRGYRVELGEIEAVLMQVPQIAQAVVQPHETQPGSSELVAYYTRKQGTGEFSLAEVSERLRKQLPAYMVPAYLEELPAIPMTSNNKADRKNLPAPRGARFAASSGAHVAPRTATEQVLGGVLVDVMKVERVSVTDNFFYDLGGHSLLMARVAAEIRKRLDITAVSMQDIYLNPTLEKLAGHIDSLRSQESVGVEQHAVARPFHVPSNLAYYGCGALQVGWYLAWGVVGVWTLVWSIHWTYAAMPDLGATYLRVLALAFAFFIALNVLPIAVKWLIVGRWKPEVIPIWSLQYFRFWVIKGLMGTAPIALIGGPVYNLYLRLLGAKIGTNTVLSSGVRPVCTDLISIGAETIIGKETGLTGYKALSNYIYTGAITIGSHVHIGEASTIDIDAVMEDGSQLGHSSTLQEGQRVPRGKSHHGTPARETTTDYRTVGPRKCTPLRRYTYALFFATIGFPLAPIGVVIFYWLFPFLYDYAQLGSFPYEAPATALINLAGIVAGLSLALFLGFGVLGLIGIAVVPRVLNFFLRTDRTYVLYGFHYFLQQAISTSTNSAFFNRLFGDSSGIANYVRWIGYRLNTIVQTGSNFGEEQWHDNPFLCDIGTGTMVSDGLKMANVSMTNTSFRLGTVKIGAQNYLGNYVRYPAEGKTGENCLLGTKVMVPIDGPVRENVGLLGSPPFEIPRAISRDRKMAGVMDEQTRRQRLRAKNIYNLNTAILFLLKTWFSAFVLAFMALVAFVYYFRYGALSVYAFGFVALFFSVFWAWFVERATLGFRPLSPQIALVLDRYYWFHERHWHLFGLNAIARFFPGTPMKNLLSRLQGVRLGKKVFDDGVVWTEYTLIEIGDYTNLNPLATIWPHSLEEGVFKSDRVKIGAGCTLESGSLVHYGVVMGDRVVLEAGSYLMKGEILDAESVWRGNPAKAIGTARIDQQVVECVSS